ncbi:hypothetical protein Taro_004119 [Colocasia esculenta]|uniref:Uncharacterized protein n=1 Tax=Colocasia esculenta TaxID=4460 RepID=A0A843TP26_COLES|nr:hypothetical protein [Colocasia esculenta]
MTSLSVRPSVYHQVLEAQQADILQMPDVELDEDSEVRVVTDTLAATWSHEGSLSQQAFECGTPGCRDMLTTGVAVAFLSRRLKVMRLLF